MSYNTTQVISNNPEALLAFTTLTTDNLIHCSNQPNARRLPPLNEFIQDFYKQKKIPCAVKLFTLIYLKRLKSKLPDHARGGPDTPYRLFLAALLTSSKYLSEAGTGLTSTHVSYLTHQLYTPKDINRMERSFLGLLRYDLWVSSDHIHAFIKAYGPYIDIDINSVNIPEHMARCLLANSPTNMTVISHPA
ncbi:uncharacterized protein EV154DRAFT_490548 [Mucor mucedo]|uniref:Cyclin N-terminal domain-containing protein n=1 Tax=Mucor saturninus TaxID=64648 RepID=A0A8H7V0J1_9FUNG|nr:uncharacterized protein EV154DRAFT_490548 [Mucor mucedo]KAG2202655.1 hypothetical protein INT47_002087 [Mucor saturninus]KAI7897131.1 hypothetical protein EV154DRAFT_490548 [Mucor mucedo]